MKTILIISALLAITLTNIFYLQTDESQAFLGVAPLYKQCDARWGSNIIGSGPDTICRVGCLMSSVAMALTDRG